MAAKRKAGKNSGKIGNSRSGKIGAKKAAVKKASAAAPAAAGAMRPMAAASAAAQPMTEDGMNDFLAGINAHKLHDDDIAATLDHLNSVVAFRRAVGQPGVAAKRVVSSKCYEKSFGDPVVSIYDGTVKVDEMTEESALAAGIPRCGA